MTEHEYDYDYLVIGGGSGGLASAKRAAAYGAKVAVVERARLGGTCVNVGCVPKKVMWSAATIAETLDHEASHYGFDVGAKPKVDWPKLKKARDAYVLRLNGIYERGLKSAGVTFLVGDATFSDSHTLQITPSSGTSDKFTVTADKILIATGGRPIFPSGAGIEEYCISSDGFFDLEELPKVAVIVGAGYIAVELAGVLNSLGSEVHLVVRKAKALREFDDTISDALDHAMVKSGIVIHRNTNGVANVTLDANTKTKTIALQNGDFIYGADTVMMAAGRVPNVEDLCNTCEFAPNVETLHLESAGVKLMVPRRFISVDEFQQTSNPTIYALGDVCGTVELTPMAIAAGRRLADRIFSPEKYSQAKVSYENVPTVVFSHPPIGTVGMSESKAVAKYGIDNIKVYNSKFADSHYGIFDVMQEDKPKTHMKVICAGEEELVVGMHVIGRGADEMMQGFGVAIKMGATKADLDSCIAIHPTASEELVTMGTWGTSAQVSGAKVSPLNGASAPEPTIRLSKI